VKSKGLRAGFAAGTNILQDKWLTWLHVMPLRTRENDCPIHFFARPEQDGRFTVVIGLES
jgi:hypothetical protein